MPTLDVASFILGGVLILLAGFGGGMTIREIQIPTLDRSMRVASLLFGIALVSAGIWINQRPKSGPGEETFHNPMYRGERLDQCFTFANDCGARAAERWCRSEQKSSSVADFEVDPNIGARSIKTKTIGSEEICTASFCTGYKYIICKK